MGVCANPGVCDFTYTFTHHGAKRSRTAIIAMDLTERAWKEHHGAPGGVHHEFTTHHESLVALLPPDETCADLFGEVENSRHW